MGGGGVILSARAEVGLGNKPEKAMTECTFKDVGYLVVGIFACYGVLWLFTGGIVWLYTLFN